MEELMSDKELFQEMRNDIKGLRDEMAETRTLIKTYNGLRDTVNKLKSKVDTLVWGIGITIPLVGLIVTVYKVAANKP